MSSESTVRVLPLPRCSHNNYFSICIQLFSDVPPHFLSAHDSPSNLAESRGGPSKRTSKSSSVEAHTWILPAFRFVSQTCHEASVPYTDRRCRCQFLPQLSQCKNAPKTPCPLEYRGILAFNFSSRNLTQVTNAMKPE